MGNIDYLSDNLIEMRGPVNLATGFAMTAIGAPTGAEVEAKLYDTSLDCRLATYKSPLVADYVESADEVFVQDNVPIAAGCIVLIQLDNGELQEMTTNSRNADGSGIAWASGTLDSAASKGNIVSIIRVTSVTQQISLDDFSGWEHGMNLEITIDDGTLIERTVSRIKPDAGYLTLSANMGVGEFATPGALIKSKVGATITDFADFGTFPQSDPVAGDPSWGYRGVIAHDHAGIRLGMRIRGEITAVDTVPTPTLNLTRKAVGTVINE